nr:Chain B, HCoV-OC43 Spike KTSHxx sorting motif [Human coronavirus OC43]8HR0_D Chain D, HCoV-OC43 [Human coronavirus OC43]
ELVIKTSHDD